MTYQELAKMAEEAGFSAWAELDVATIELKAEVRDMCAANSCGQYGKRWSCPPGCGTLEECGERLKGYTKGILVQTYGDIEDGFDFEAMMEIEGDHKEHFGEMYEALREEALYRCAWECMVDGAPKKNDVNDITYIPVDEKTLARKNGDLMILYDLVPEIAVQAHKRIHGIEDAPPVEE